MTRPELLDLYFQQPDNNDLPARQKLVAIILAIVMLLVVLELTRRRKLREEYSVLWILTAVALLALALNYSILVALTHLIGTVLPQSTLVFFGLLFLMLLALQFSVRLSRMTYRMRKLAQKVAMLEAELRNGHTATPERPELPDKSPPDDEDET